MCRLVIASLVFLLAVGCKDREESARGAFQAPKPLLEPAAKTNLRPIIDTPDPAIIDNPELLREKVDEPEERNLAAELQRAVGIPIDCLTDYESSTPTKLQIPISATVRPTGIVIEPTVGGVGLSPKERACIQERMSFVKLPPLDEPRSQAVSTFVEIDYEPPVVVESDAPPDPDLKNVKESLPKRPEVAPSGKPITGWPTSKWISGGFDGGRPVEGPRPKKVTGPKPRAIDGYEVDENAQEWR
jgi:hypothetical protein